MKVTVYSAAWCGPCKMLHPAFKKEGIEYTKIDIDADLEKAKVANVKGVPTTIITDDEGEEVRRLVGFSPKVLKEVKKELNISE